MNIATLGPRTTLNALVIGCSEALAVLGTFGMDACCGGALPLEEAARRHGHDPEVVLAALRQGCSSCAGEKT